MNKPTKNTIGQILIWAFAIVIQIGWIIFAVIVLQNRFPIIQSIISILSIIAVFWLMSRDINPAFKLAWTILILAVPIAGVVIYVLLGRNWFGSEMKRKLDRADRDTVSMLRGDVAQRVDLRKEDEVAARQSDYIRGCAKFPLYEDTQTRYFACGEDFFPVFLEELNKAEHFIFLEYFIIDEGEMWGSVYEILEQKVKAGVDVRVIYDGWGCASKVPKSFKQQLKDKGIKCEEFNPLVPIASVIQNNRDHRKIAVIDGQTAFTGGINLSDEYINRIERFGYWKDSAVMLHGEAVWSFTLMFLRMWKVLTDEPIIYERFRPHTWHEESFMGFGFVQPFADTPLDNETVGENIYMNIINHAKKYIYIFTPYLIIDNEMKTALTLAAKSGVDVRIVTPGIPDKKYVFLLTQSYYEPLIKAGVRIFEYTPGFLHSKSFVCDDKIAVVGSINMDFRSFYMHFECGVWMYGTEAVMEVKRDALDTFEVCEEITEEDCEKSGYLKRFWQSILRLFAPLM